uniref:Uncharacterized protein n=1 Tax=Glossina brevipalpis TaxID=37001 RepID=A0A1A9WAZ2_9MUSC
MQRCELFTLPFCILLVDKDKQQQQQQQQATETNCRDVEIYIICGKKKKHTLGSPNGKHLKTLIASGQRLKQLLLVLSQNLISAHHLRYRCFWSNFGLPYSLVLMDD